MAVSGLPFELLEIAHQLYSHLKSRGHKVGTFKVKYQLHFINPVTLFPYFLHSIPGCTKDIRCQRLGRDVLVWMIYCCLRVGNSSKALNCFRALEACGQDEINSPSHSPAVRALYISTLAMEHRLDVGSEFNPAVFRSFFSFLFITDMLKGFIFLADRRQGLS